ncbi:hypothetical protein PF010_g25354 [Phytophthora fragariae]|uniref:Protein kinase domain-containing protein n=1 Tax=Phytophthora fragariae TaxID=53985 RepID=A0A6A3R550_9STRA|nr:hypothetical protein PF003_g28355 [Phytophthora fragariae]KAE8975027.1 hypothetical protein PF011_g24633 [Phytophthora fragariae]KAE9072764.1 hypothetical protein PF010_g25354 [Phytophthora fragariae]KAE9073140.1 hypothetical protein PF007_g25912 [Phytophthora fragariae]KAE9090157.1 hypothetical protein PF006_g25212 [Phytophthora fragariae]
MSAVAPRRRRRKFHLLTLSAALAMSKNVLVLGASGSSDVLTRCESLQSDTAMLSTPSETELPTDVAATLFASSDVAWSDLDDLAKVGLLWVHGYVFSGGSSNGDKAGDALVQVYTRCSDDSATGVAMADLGVSYDDFTGQGSRCEAATCGSYSQATNAHCVANVTSVLQCAVSGASSTLSTASDVSFWSSVTSSSTVPYPQVYGHNLTLADATRLQVYSIHMRNSDAGVSCGNTLDTIVPCLRLEDVTTSGTTSTSGWCKPTVDAAKVKSFLDAVTTVQVTQQSDDNGSSDGASDTGLILAIGGGVLVVVVVLIVCCCCRRKRMRRDEQLSETAAIGTAREPSETASATRSGLGFIPRMIGRRGKNSDSGSETSSNAATNVNVQTNRGRRSSWYTFGNASNRESTAYGRRSSMAGSWVGAAGGKTVSEYCSESEILTDFMQDPEVFTKRIAFDELTFLRMLSKGAYGEPFSDVTSDKGERLPGMQLAQLVRLGKIRVSLRKDCPPNLRKLVMDCTQLDPDARPSSMQVAFTLKSIIAPTLRMSSSTATTASTSSSSSFPSSGGHVTAGQALQRPSPSVKDGRI